MPRFGFAQPAVEPIIPECHGGDRKPTVSELLQTRRSSR
jgi:hypothetical protein